VIATMTKAKEKQAAVRKVADRLSPAAELAVIKRTVASLKANPEALREVARRAGIVTARGKLTKSFGG
jgi:hypothetical protein